MFKSAILAAALAASFVVADPVPLEPDSTSVFNEGGNCTILWSVQSSSTLSVDRSLIFIPQDTGLDWKVDNDVH
jgi:hypothetical protein